MQRMLLGTGLLLIVVSGQVAVPAQEPAYYLGNPGIRFEQSAGVFHYLYRCQTGRELQYPSKISSRATGASERAMCWPVWAVRMTKNGATFDASPLIYGRIMSSAHNVRFIPNDDKDSDLYSDFRPDELQVQHKAGELFALLVTKDVFFKFGFSNLCNSCTSGTHVQPSTNAAQLEQEFGFVQDSLKQFDSTWQKVNDLSARIRVEIRAANQPGVSDLSESLPLYADLNTRFAELCSEPAKSCVRAFAAFEKCESASWGAECGRWPACSEACAITMQDLRKLGADACVQFDQQGASLTPDWSDVVKTKKTSDLPSRSFVPGVVELQMKPGPDPPSGTGCSVNASFVRASMPGGFGVAGMEGLGGNPGAPGTIAPPPVKLLKARGPEPVNIAAGVALGMLVKKVPPEYPPVARAARVSGTVVLQATISKTGTIEDLRVVDGPPLLRSAALDAVKQWQYKPFQLNGEPVEVLTTINVIFTLGNPPAPAPTGLQTPGQGTP